MNFGRQFVTRCSLGWCYASDLTDLIVDRRPDLWMHGHVHHAVDYGVGRTRVICNPRGHTDEATGFLPGLVVECA